MNNIDFFIKGCQLGSCYYTEWVFSVFCLTDIPEQKDHKHFPLRLYKRDGLLCYHAQDLDPQAADEYVFILFNGKPMSPERDGVLVQTNEEITITPKDIPSLQKPTLKTTPGIFFFNYYCLIYGVGKNWPYVEGPNIIPGKIAKEIVAHVKDEPEHEQDKKEDEIYVSNFKKLLSAIASFSGFCSINSPSATPYTMTGSPEVQKRKAELLKENKDQLDNPVVIAQIEKELIELDKKYIAQDPNKGFYISNKPIENARKKVHGIQGLQKRMDRTKPAVLVPNALTEGMDRSTLAAQNDHIRTGSFFRSKMTALGGAEVKFIYRVYNASAVIKEDCGSRLTIPRLIDEKNMARFIGAYIVENGQDVCLTNEVIKKYVGKVVQMRSPGFCRADPHGRGFCIRCMGESIRGYEKSLASYGAGVSNGMMYRFMKAMHDDTSKTVKLKLDTAIT